MAELPKDMPAVGVCILVLAQLQNWLRHNTAAPTTMLIVLCDSFFFFLAKLYIRL